MAIDPRQVSEKLKNSVKTTLAQTGRSLRKWSLRALIFVVIVGGIAGAYVLTGTYSRGIRAGKVVKVSQRGYLMKTWEGQLDLGMFGANPAAPHGISEVFEFSIPSGRADLIKKLEDSALSGERIRLSYEERYVRLPWVGDTKYMAIDAETESPH